MDSVRLGRPVKRAAGLFALAAALTPAALAQQTPAQPAQTATRPAAEGVQSFDVGFFKQYNPVTAADMVNRVPGCVEQVIINGKLAVADQQVVPELGQQRGFGTFLPAR